MLDAHILFDVPGGHFTSDNLPLDRLCPGAYLLVGQQRHRCNRSLAMTDLTMVLQDRRDVFGERHLFLRHRYRGHSEDRDYSHQKDDWGLHCRKPPERCGLWFFRPMLTQGDLLRDVIKHDLKRESCCHFW